MKITERLDSHTHIPKERLRVNPPFPTTLKIEITTKCNYRCEYCALKDSKRPPIHIDPDFMFKILKDAKNAGVKEIGFFLLGEPLMNPDLESYITYAKELDLYTFVTTNGYFCDVARFKSLEEAGLDSLKFSMNAVDKYLYKKLHKVDGFKRVLNNLIKVSLVAKRTKISVSNIWNEEHKDKLEMFKDFIECFGKIEHYFLPHYNQAGLVKGKVVGNIGRFENPVPPVPCWSIFTAAKITVDGWLTACCFDHHGDFKIADLNDPDMPLLKAWRSYKFQKLRECHLNKKLKGTPCAKCVKK